MRTDEVRAVIVGKGKRADNERGALRGFRLRAVEDGGKVRNWRGEERWGKVRTDEVRSNGREGALVR